MGPGRPRQAGFRPRTGRWLRAWALCAAGALLAFAAPASAQGGLRGAVAERLRARADLAQPAPPLRGMEEIPPPRDGFVWSPGYWTLRDGRYVYRQGRYVAVPGAERPRLRERRLPLRRR